MSRSVTVSSHPQLRLILPQFSKSRLRVESLYTYTASSRTNMPIETPTTIISRDRTSPFVTDPRDTADPLVCRWGS